jgi:transcription elongation GreA/GreB family factor
MLGRRVGEQIEWQIPYGARRFEVSAVQFQPEAVLALAA